ncbi:unnamed protein product [Hymenolepis diminuta]|uniref:PWI domain-containing protein n=3 Tax=Hymenolepis diminuta TaxID=6216 RepID=A0A564Z857_HYMDI|nr:unnamed protein product [Hymenolepis diminuta]
MNPYGNFFGVPQPYYGAIPPNYSTYVPPNLMGYTAVPTVATTVTVSQPSTTQTSKTETNATAVAQVIVTQDKTPVTTVFVGNIPDRAPDSVIKALLMRCGNILSWKRVQGASGNYQAFGFCEYQSPESTLRCVRLLNNFEILEKKLMVKVDAKTEELLKEYQKKNKGGTDDEKKIDEEDQDDEVVKTALQNILQEAIDTYQLGHESPNRAEYLEGPRHLTIDDLDIDGERKDLINKEIETFRRRNEKETPAEDRNKRTRDLDFYTSRYSSSSRTAATTRSDRDSERGGGSRYSRSRSRSREPSKKRPRGGVTSSSLVSDKHYRSSRSVDEEEEAIKKRLERKLKEKEESYQSRLRQWEARERKKQDEYEHDAERDKKKQEYMQTEAKSLLEFLTAYDDEIEDPKYYKGSALQRRLTDREVEETADERDCQKEHEQLEATRKKLLEEGNPEVETIILQMEQAMQEHLQKRLNLDAKSPKSSSSVSRDVSPESHSIDIPKVSSSGFRPVSPESESGIAESASVKETNKGDLPRKDSSTFLFSMSSKTNDNVIKPAAAFDDDEVEAKSKRPALSFVPPSASEKTTASRSNSSNYPDLKAVANLSVAEKKAIIKQIIERIPTNMEELFTYPIDWRAVDADLVDERIKPWVDKKIVEYLGEPEATLSKFICEQLLEHKPPAKMLSDIALVLEEEAEVFVAKMWRLLIYAIAEKNLGLSM